MGYEHYHLYIASGTSDGGIYQYSLNETGQTRFIAKYPLGKTMYMATWQDRLYVLLVTPQEKDGELTFFQVEEDGTLSGQGKKTPTKGKEACHLTLDNGQAYCVNYDSGSVIKMPDKLVTHRGQSVHPARQETAHTHYVCITPDRKYVCVVDLGLDKIMVYDKDLNPISETAAPRGYGPRHLVFAKDGKNAFCANELVSSVSAYSYRDGRFTLLDTYSALPENFQGESYSAAIRLTEDGTRLFVSNRGHDSLCCFSISGDKLSVRSFTECGGCWPRDFILAGGLLICTNERSDNVTLFRADGYNLTKLDTELSVPAPLAALAIGCR